MEYSNEAINLVEQVISENFKDTANKIKDNFEKRQAMNQLIKTMRKPYKPQPLTDKEKLIKIDNDAKATLQNKLNKVGRDGMTFNELNKLKALEAKEKMNQTKHEAACILIEALNTLLNE